MDIKQFVNITSKAWALPILWSLHAGVGGRQAPLIAATGASRTAFTHSVDHLIALGLLERNRGHGHPLRPEFRLTPKGLGAAEMASQIRSVLKEGDQDLLRRSWTLPVLASLHTARHFNDIKRTLHTITDRALSQALKSMETRAWVRRNVDSVARPPRSIYVTMNTGERISTMIAPQIRFIGPSPSWTQ